MPRQWTKTEAFAHFGATMTNIRWSWSGMSPDRNSVVVVLWQDAIKRTDGQFVYADDEELDAAWRQRPGHAERIEHLRHSRDCLDGRFRAVIARAVDIHADPRDIASCHPQQDVWWQLDHFDEATGAFRAHALREA